MDGARIKTRSAKFSFVVGRVVVSTLKKRVKISSEIKKEPPSMFKGRATRMV
jgi:hypothetical protein